MLVSRLFLHVHTLQDRVLHFIFEAAQQKLLDSIGRVIHVSWEDVMAANLALLESLLAELSEMGATLEEKGITPAPSLAPLVVKAQHPSIRIPSAANLDDLRSAVEEACEQLRTPGVGKKTAGHPLPTKEIPGNTSGIPGEGP